MMYRTHIMITLNKINTENIRPIHYLEKVDKRPILGASMFPELYSNIFICAKKKSGKTTIISHIIKKCTNKQTKVVVFSSTLNKDTSWKAIKKHCEDNGVDFVGYTSLLDDDGHDTLKDLTTVLMNDFPEEGKEQEKEVIKKPILLFEGDDQDEEKKPKKKVYKYQSPEYLIVFDDLADQLRSKSISTFLKKNRHFKSKVILSSQYVHDLSPESWKQLDYILLLKGQPDEKLKKIYEVADLSIEYNTFHKIYKHSTQDRFNFLYIDTNNQVYRKNFSQEYTNILK